MSHRRLSLRRLVNRNEDEELVDDTVENYDSMTEVSIADERQIQDEATILSQITSYPSKLGSWLNCQFDRNFDEKTDDFIKLIPSIISFLLGLLVVKMYGDSLDNAIAKFFESSGRVLQNFFTILSKLDGEDFDKIASVFLVLLFWIGAARFVGNLACKIINAPKIYKK